MLSGGAAGGAGQLACVAGSKGEKKIEYRMGRGRFRKGGASNGKVGRVGGVGNDWGERPLRCRHVIRGRFPPVLLQRQWNNKGDDTVQPALIAPCGVRQACRDVRSLFPLRVSNNYSVIAFTSIL